MSDGVLIPVRVGCEILSQEMPAKIPSEVPSVWKKQAIENVQTRRWLEAIVYGLTHHVWVDGEKIGDKRQTQIEQSLKTVIQKINEARWGIEQELQKASGGEASARLIHYPDRDEKDVILLNPHLLGEKGNREFIDGSHVPVRCLALLHEGAHVLFREPRM